jgi:hypothetical protein
MATVYLQEAANALETWFRLWRIEVNPEKNSAVLNPDNTLTRSA